MLHFPAGEVVEDRGACVGFRSRRKRETGKGKRESKSTGDAISLHLAPHHPREGFRWGRGYRHMTISPDLRARLSPPFRIPSSSSPILLSRATLPSAASADPSHLPAIARGIRATIAKFDASAIGAVLRDLAFDTAAGRVWNVFLGQRDLIVTGWVRVGLYDVRVDGGEEGEAVVWGG